MNRTDVTKEGLRNVATGRDALVGQRGGGALAPRTGRRRARQQLVVPDAEFTSYYGRAVLKEPTWTADIPSYFFLGGLAGGGSVVAACAGLTGRPTLARVSKLGSFAAIGLSTAALVHDLGKPSRFYNMLRVFKASSPMSVGSWILAGYGPMAGLAAAGEVVGPLAVAGRVATLAAAALGPAVASYTGVLLADTAVPAWHGAHRELPFIFASSGAVAASGLGLLAAPVAETAPLRHLAAAGALFELAAIRRMERRDRFVAEPYREGRGGRLMRASEALLAAGVGTALVGRRSRAASAAAGAALLAASACTRFGFFEAGKASARDPKYTVVPQRRALDARVGVDAPLSA